MSSPGVGTQLGNYQLEALLGRGGMGVVYRAVDVRLGRMVALKLLAPHLADDALFRARFLAESRQAASIDHAGIVPIYEAGESDGQLFIAMRYVEGTDLASLLRREGALVPRRGVELVRQLADALDAAHARGLVHRDVKPSNALVALEGAADHVYLADFGLTKHIATSGAVTASDHLVGTIDYLAPERIRGEPADGRADLYSLGCVLFECLTGEVPFDRDSDVAAMYAHLEDEPPRPSERRAGVPAALDGVVERALAKDPQRRWQSGAELGAAAHAALTGSPAPVSAVVRRGRPPARRFLVGVGLGAALLGLLFVLTLAHSDGRRRLAVAAGDEVAVIDPTHSALTDEVAKGSSPSQIAVGADAVWIANADAGTVTRIDRRTRQSRTTAVGSGPSAVAVGAGGIWVVNSLDGTLTRISPTTDRVVGTIPVGNGPSGVCVAAGAVWVARAYDRSILRVDPATGRRSTTSVDDEPTALACGGGSVWAASESAGTVTQLRASGRGEVLGRIPVGNGPSGLAWGFGALWVANTADGTVSRIDGRSGAASALIVGSQARPTSVAVGARGVWVSNENAGTIVRIDPAGKQVVRTLTIGNQPLGLAVVGGSLWVGVRATNAQHRGGTLRILQPAVQAGATGPWSADNVDSANGYNGWGILPLTNDGLVAFRRAGGRQAATLVADLAVSIPAPTDGGRTYTFRLRPGIRYSTGTTVRAADIRRGIERLLRRAGVSSAPASYYAGIVGARRCSPRRCDLSSGIAVDEPAGTIAFHLTGPDPDFLKKLALPNAVAVPAGVGARLRRPLPATGPYRIARLTPPASLRLVRNPHFVAVDGRPDGYPDAITIDTGARGARAPIRAVQDGRADFFGGAFGPPPSVQASLGAIGTRYPAQLHTTPGWVTDFAFLNTRVAPFDNLDVRRALNYAVDRGAFVALKGGPRFAEPTCQFLPPDFPGYRPYCPYTAGAAGPGRAWRAPDLARARRLVARSHTRGMHVTVVGPRNFPNSEAAAVEQLLQRLGYRTTRRSLPENVPVSAYVADSRHRAQIGALQWGVDYASGSGYLQPMFSCAAFVPGVPSQLNYSEFCDRRADRLMRRAQRLPFGAPGADALWAAADRRIADQAAVVPLTNPAAVAFVSRRVGDYQYSPQWGSVLYDQLWVR
jgi:YVTN family beta-propeller protein